MRISILWAVSSLIFLGKIPGRYEKTEWNGYEFVIQSVDGHKIRQVKVVKKKGN